MRRNRLQKSKRKPQNLDQYESSSASSSEIEIVRTPCKRKRQPNETRTSRKDSPYGLRNSIQAQSSISRAPVGLSEETSSNLSSSPITVHRTWKPTPSKVNLNNPPQTMRNDKKKIHALSTLERKRLELEAAKREEMRREENISFVSNRIIDELAYIGVTCREIAQLCSDKLGWNFIEWKDVLKGSQVTIYGPVSRGTLSSRKRSNSWIKKNLSPYTKSWNPSLEVDALSLCILKSGGTTEILQEGFRTQRNLNIQSKQPSGSEVIKNITNVKCVFVHRTVINDFLSGKQTSLVELTRMKPRVQIFVFGNGPEPSSREMILISPKVELVLCTGAVIVPTFDSLFKKSRRNVQGGRHHFERMKKLCLFHPFLKVCLHPSIVTRAGNCLSDDGNRAGIDKNFLIDFLADSDFEHSTGDKPAQAKDLADWIKLERNNVCWLWSDSGVQDQGRNAEISEVDAIVKTLKGIQRELYTEYRKFIIALPEEHPYSNRSSIGGIELIELGKLESDHFI